MPSHASNPLARLLETASNTAQDEATQSTANLILNG